MTQLEGFIEKGWGHEFIWATNDKYCGKFLQFNKGAKFCISAISFNINWYFISKKLREDPNEELMGNNLDTYIISDEIGM